MIIDIEHIFYQGNVREVHHQSVMCETINEAETAANEYRFSSELTPAQRAGWVCRNLYIDGKQLPR